MAPTNKGALVRKSRYSEEKMVTILREADRSPVAEVAKKHAVSEQTIYTGVSTSERWRAST